MLKPTLKRGLMLDFIPDEIIYPAEINQNRIFELNNNDVKDDDIVYIVTREFRLEDNWAIIFAQYLALKHNKNLKLYIVFDSNYYSEKQYDFMMSGLNFFTKNLAQNKINYEILYKMPQNINAGVVVCDFNPINLMSDFAKNCNCIVYEVDSHNIIPARFVSNKQEFSAATLRRKIYANITEFLTEFPNKYNIIKNGARVKLDEFITDKLDFYADSKNDPNINVTSNLSPYLHFGFISAQRIALEIIKSSASRANKEAFLEELVVRKELSDNFCLYAKNFSTLESIPNWAKDSLNAHRDDIRTYAYKLSEFEYGKTHDELWNKIQLNLLKTRKIHGYLRMYWAKKILEWSKSPEYALETAIYLNDKYALDGNDSNGYVGILWSVGGIHDRPFQNRLVTGRIRYMSYSACKNKFNVKEYIDKEA